MTAKGFENFFQRGRAGEKRASRSTGKHCPLQTTETKMLASLDENRSFLLGYGAEDLRGMPLRTRKREPLEEAQANHPWTPRVPLDSLTEPQRGGQEVRTSRKIRSC